MVFFSILIFSVWMWMCDCVLCYVLCTLWTSFSMVNKSTLAATGIRNEIGASSSCSMVAHWLRMNFRFHFIAFEYRRIFVFERQTTQIRKDCKKNQFFRRDYMSGSDQCHTLKRKSKFEEIPNGTDRHCERTTILYRIFHVQHGNFRRPCRCRCVQKRKHKE